MKAVPIHICANTSNSVGNLAQVHFAANVFSLPLKTEAHPHGVYTEHELYMVLAIIFTYIFSGVDNDKSFPIQMAARTVTQQLGTLVEANVKSVNRTGWISGIVDVLHQEQSPLKDYGVHMVRRLLESGMDTTEITWSQIVPTAGAMVAYQAQVVSNRQLILVASFDFFVSSPNCSTTTCRTRERCISLRSTSSPRPQVPTQTTSFYTTPWKASDSTARLAPTARAGCRRPLTMEVVQCR